MNYISEVLCEIIFFDNKYHCLTSRIGTIDDSQLLNYAKNLNGFIIFKEKYKAPILKSDIKEIIVYQNIKQDSFEIEYSGISKYVKFQRTVKIS